MQTNEHPLTVEMPPVNGCSAFFWFYAGSSAVPGSVPLL